MEVEFIGFSSWALDLREGINIGITIFLPVLALLFLRIVRRAWNHTGREYRFLTRTEKGLIGLAIMFAGEAARSATVWNILHTKGESGTYLAEIIPLVFSLFAVVIGAACAVRNFTPQRDAAGWPVWGGHRLWVVCVALYLVVAVINWGAL
jgi:hypothetical protein